MQLSYVVEVVGEGEGADFIVNKGEHSMGVWAGVGDLENVPITEEMKRLVPQALGCGEGA